MLDRYDNAINLMLSAFLVMLMVYLFINGLNPIFGGNGLLGAAILLVLRLFYMMNPFRYNHLAKSYIALFVVLSLGQLWIIALLPLLAPWLADPFNMMCRVVNVFLVLFWLIGIGIYLANYGIHIELF